MIGSGNLELVTERSDHRFELCDGLLSGLELVTHRASAAMRHLGPSPWRRTPLSRPRGVEGPHVRRALPVGEPAGVAARPAPSTAVVDDEHVVDRAVEEGPVVADDHHRAAPRVEEVLQRTEGVQIEVIGGLIEEQHVRFGRQREYQLKATALTARQQLDRRFLHVAVEPEAFE